MSLSLSGARSGGNMRDTKRAPSLPPREQKVISLYYYFGVIRAIYWSKEPGDLSPIAVSIPLKVSLTSCIFGMLFLGIYPNPFLKMAGAAVMMSR